MEDQELIEHIGRLVNEEHELESHTSTGGVSEADTQRLHRLEVQLDQCWDLLRQRRGRRDAGESADSASSRPASTVEGYQQ
jgi:hypothetical protein